MPGTEDCVSERDPLYMWLLFIVHKALMSSQDAQQCAGSLTVISLTEMGTCLYSGQTWIKCYSIGALVWRGSLLVKQNQLNIVLSIKHLLKRNWIQLLLSGVTDVFL